MGDGPIDLIRPSSQGRLIMLPSEPHPSWPALRVLRHRALVLWGAAALVFLSIVFALRGPLTERGLVARYFAGPQWADAPRLVSYAEPIAGDWATSYADRAGERSFSASWRGWLLADRSGRYSFSLHANDAAWLHVDGQPLLAATTDQGERRASIPLAAGLHEFRVDYVQHGGLASLRVGWARGRDALTPLDSSVLFPTRLAFYLRAFMPPGVLLALCWSALILGLAVAALGRRVVLHLRRHPGSPRENRLLATLLGTTILLAIVPLWWGLPTGWEADELRPRDIVPALEQWYSGGWHDHYPPAYFYALGVLTLPFSIAARLGVADLWTTPALSALLVVYRLSAALAMVALVYLAYLCGREVFGTRAAGLWSGFFLAVAPNVVFHGKLAKPDLPYVALFALAFLFYLRAVRHRRGADYVRFALAATLAVCTKDQAYGLFVLPVAHLVWVRLRGYEGRMSRRAVALFRDPALWSALAGAAVTFVLVHNVVLNFDGFVKHLALITGGGSAPFRMYERSLQGHVAMARDTALQLPWNVGWPAACVVLAGFVHLFRRDRTAWLTLLLPVASYYLFFIAVVMFQYDRFYLPALLPAAVAAGGVFAHFLRGPELTRWRRVAAAGIAGYTFLYGASVNILMLRDSRYSAEHWLKANASDDVLVAFVGPAPYLPRPQTFKSEWMTPDPEILAVLEPDLVVINAEYMKRLEKAPAASFASHLTAGRFGNYTRVASFKSAPGPAILAYNRVFSNDREDPFTNLDKINPEIQIFARAAAGDPAAVRR